MWHKKRRLIKRIELYIKRNARANPGIVPLAEADLQQRRFELLHHRLLAGAMEPNLDGVARGDLFDAAVGYVAEHAAVPDALRLMGGEGFGKTHKSACIT